MIGSYIGLFAFRNVLYSFFSQSEFHNYVDAETSLRAHFTTILCTLLSLILYKRLKENNTNAFFIFVVFFDFACIPIQNQIGFFRLHYLFLLPRLYMWGKILDVLKIRIKPRQVEVVGSIAFIAWTIFRFLREYEAASLMPYVVELIK